MTVTETKQSRKQKTASNSHLPRWILWQQYVIESQAGREGEVKKHCPGSLVLVGFRQCSGCFGADSSLIRPPKLKSHLPSWHTEVKFAAYFRADEMIKTLRCSTVKWCGNICSIHSHLLMGRPQPCSWFPRMLALCYGMQCIFSRDLKSLEGNQYGRQRN